MSLWSLERRDGVALLRYDNPPRNFISFAALAELEGELERIAGDADVRVVLLASALPGCFATHADLDELARLADGPPPEARHWYTAFRALERIPQPVVAAVDGQAWGGAVELMLACTLRLASERAHLRLLEVDLGIIPGAGGTQRLARLVGPGRAADLVLTGRVVGAREAQTLGLVERVLPVERFELRALAFAQELAEKPAGALRDAKRAILEGGRADLRDGLRLEADLFAALLRSDESRARQELARAQYAAAAPTEHVPLAAASLSSVAASA